jgi:hypothetical protein
VILFRIASRKRAWRPLASMAFLVLAAVGTQLANARSSHHQLRLRFRQKALRRRRRRRHAWRWSFVT